MALTVAAVSAGMCNDKRPDCSNWARDGECTGDNSVRLPPPTQRPHRERPLSAGRRAEAAGTRSRGPSDAPSLSRSSPVPLLLLEQKFMAIECPLSCGICTHLCNDTDASCGAWATAGECEANPEAMLRLCPTSCGLCTPECSDLDKECTAWGAAGECNTNPEFMIRQCPVTCEACKSTCKDIQQDCPGWTADGECFKNPGFMCAAAAATMRLLPP